MLRLVKRIGITLGVLIVLFGVMQLVPYGRDHTNPPVIAEPAWDSPQTRALAVRACFSCHSNETKWPWYSHVAPFSWVVQHNVNNGRTVINFSEWNRTYDLAPQTVPNVLSAEMPPRMFRLAHPEARLTDDEKMQLARGLNATLGLNWRDLAANP
jgi:hypothetical protein